MTFETFETYAERLLRSDEVPGAAVAAARSGTVVYARGFGAADRDAGIPAGPDTIFGVASVTKSFTAAAVMRLADDGRLSVDDPVVEYLPEFRLPRGDAPAVRIHHFLTHTPGFPPLPSRWYAFGASAREDSDGTPPPVDVGARPPFETPEDLMSYLANGDWTPLGPPGACFSYCNEGYALLDAIVARVSGRPYTRYVAETILEPAGLTSTAFGPPPPHPPAGAMPMPPGGVTTPYIAKKANGRRMILPARTWWYSEVWHPAGGICSTVTDLARYLELYRTGGMVGGRRVLSERAVAAMTRPHVRVGPGQGYGYGLSVLPEYRGGVLVGHHGGRRSISAQIAVVPSRGAAVAVLANLADAPVSAIAYGLVNVLDGADPDVPPIVYPEYACPPERLRVYAGEYRSAEGTLVRVSADGAMLTIVADDMRLATRPVGPDAFVVRPHGLEQYVHFLVDGRPGAGAAARAVAYGSRIIARSGPPPHTA
ncbi:MAG TPA: serine hydrolase domain-containing protein [bacterium]|nr:serine hydrolase domain-containing protein [bacterium]